MDIWFSYRIWYRIITTLKEIYIDNDKEDLIVGKPNFEYEVVHTEYYPERDTKKIWVSKK